MEDVNLKLTRLIVRGEDIDLEIVRSVIPPDEEGVCWEIELVDESVIYVTGDVYAKYEPVIKEVKPSASVVRHIKREEGGV